MRSLTAPFHLDKDFQGQARSPAGSSPAPMTSQARSPGPGAAPTLSVSRTPAQAVAFLGAAQPGLALQHLCACAAGLGELCSEP